jgi:hypothetical protein
MEEVSSNNSIDIWYVAVSARAEFTRPQFHFGERVSLFLEDEGNLYQVTGRVMGMWFHNDNWNYDINLDVEEIEKIESKLDLAGTGALSVLEQLG